MAEVVQALQWWRFSEPSSPSLSVEHIEAKAGDMLCTDFVLYEMVCTTGGLCVVFWKRCTILIREPEGSFRGAAEPDLVHYLRISGGSVISGMRVYLPTSDAAILVVPTNTRSS